MGANGVFADGSVRLLEESMEEAVLTLLCRRADGQQIATMP
jgi:prepilin-type processing-associated H-X9-DG protein